MSYYMPQSTDNPPFPAQAIMDSCDIAALALQGYGNGVLSGFDLLSISGMVSQVGYGAAIYRGQQFTTAGGTVTHSPADLYDRRDIIISSAAGEISIVKGTPCTVQDWTLVYGLNNIQPPLKPSFPDTAILLYEVYIPGRAITLTYNNVVDKRVSAVNRDAGPQGAQGDAGPQGAQGSDGVNSIDGGVGIGLDTTTTPGRTIINAKSGYFRAVPKVVNQFWLGGWGSGDSYPSGPVDLGYTPTPGNVLLSILCLASQGAPSLDWVPDVSSTLINQFWGPSTSNGNYIAATYTVVPEGSTNIFNPGVFNGSPSYYSNGSTLYVFELTDVDVNNPVDTFVFENEVGGFPISGFPTSPLEPYDLGELAFSIGAIVNPNGPAYLGPQATPTGGTLVIPVGTNNNLSLNAVYYVGITEENFDTGIIGHVVGEIDGEPYNPGNAGAVEAVILMRGRPYQPTAFIQSIEAGTGISVDNTNPQIPVVNNTAAWFGDSRMHLAMLEGPLPDLPNGEWIVIGQDSQPWRPSGSYWAAGNDISLNADGKTIDFINAGTYMVRLAFQISAYENINLYMATGDAANGHNFPGWLNGDPDPVCVAVFSGNQDAITNWIWRITGGGSFTIALKAEYTGAMQHLDGVEIDIVRIA